MKEEIKMKDRKRNECMNEGGEDILVSLPVVFVPWARAKQLLIGNYMSHGILRRKYKFKL